MMLFGLLGFILEHFNFPLAPMVLGIILGPMAENALQQSLLMAGGSYAIFVRRPICISSLVPDLASIFYSAYSTIVKKNKVAEQQ